MHFGKDSRDKMMDRIVTQTVDPADLGQVRYVEGRKKIADNYAAYLCDESRLEHQGVDRLFFPQDESQLVAVFRTMGQREMPVTISGARTGLVGGAVPFGGAVVSLERFNKVLALRYDQGAEEWRLLVACCVTLGDLNNWVAKKHFPGLQERGSEVTREAIQQFQEDPASYFYPPDPTETSASIGGTVATNASGARTFRYGPTRNWVRSIRVVLASGEVLSIPRGRYLASPGGTFTIVHSSGRQSTVRVPTYKMPGTKNTAGFFAAPGVDLIDLFIGSEGLFGVITEVEVALAKRHNAISVVQFLPSVEKAVALVILLREKAPIKPDFLEFYDSRSLDLLRQRQKLHPRMIDMPPIPEEAGAALFYDFPFTAQSCREDYAFLDEFVKQCGSSLARSWAGYEPRELERFKHFRHLLPEIVNSIIAETKTRVPEIHKLGTDLAVPDHALEEMWLYYRQRLERSGLHWVAFGHIGNNHLHINILPKTLEELRLGLTLYREFACKAVALGGTVSAEHGIGKMKKPFLALMYSPAALEEMRALKRTFDPGLLLNRGSVLDF